MEDWRGGSDDRTNRRKSLLFGELMQTTITVITKERRPITQEQYRDSNYDIEY